MCSPIYSSFFSSFFEKCPLKKSRGKKHELPQVMAGHVIPGASMWPPQPLLIDLGRSKTLVTLETNPPWIEMLGIKQVIHHVFLNSCCWFAVIPSFFFVSSNVSIGCVGWDGSYYIYIYR